MKVYFTFPASSSLANAYMKVEAPHIPNARQQMADMYGFPLIFAFSYKEEDFLHQITDYNLYEIPFGYMPEER